MKNRSMLIATAAMTIAFAVQASIKGIELDEVRLAAAKAGLVKPYKLQRLPADRLVGQFVLADLTESERNELSKMDAHSPLCGRGDGAPMQPCPVQKGTEFGVLYARTGGCVWSPRLGIPARSGGQNPVVGVTGIRCSAEKEEWLRIQRTALPV